MSDPGLDEQLPAFEYDAAPRSTSCEKCGSTSRPDLRFVIVRGRSRYLGRTLCDLCSEEVLEALIAAPATDAL